MCGRYSMYSTRDQLARLFGFETGEADDAPYLFPRYNVAPMQVVAVVRLDPFFLPSSASY